MNYEHIFWGHITIVRFSRWDPFAQHKKKKSSSNRCIFLPSNGSFFVNYIITAALIGTALELLRFSELFMYGLKLMLARSQAEKAAVRKVRYTCVLECQQTGRVLLGHCCCAVYGLWSWIYLFYFIRFIIPFMKFRPPYLGKAKAAVRAVLPSPTSACWIFSCFRNPQNSNMDYRIFNVRMRSFFCVRIHTGVGHADN